MSLWEKLQREIIGAISDQATSDIRRANKAWQEEADRKRAEFEAAVSELGNELAFAVLGLESEPAGTKAVFEIELRGRKRKVTVE